RQIHRYCRLPLIFPYGVHHQNLLTILSHTVIYTGGKLIYLLYINPVCQWTVNQNCFLLSFFSDKSDRTYQRYISRSLRPVESIDSSSGNTEKNSKTCSRSQYQKKQHCGVI